MSIIRTRQVEVRYRSAPMSLHFDDADPVSECHLEGCQWHAHGDSLTDAVVAWLDHLTKSHREDWE